MCAFITDYAYCFLIRAFLFPQATYMLQNRKIENSKMVKTKRNGEKLHFDAILL